MRGIEVEQDIQPDGRADATKSKPDPWRASPEYRVAQRTASFLWAGVVAVAIIGVTVLTFIWFSAHDFEKSNALRDALDAQTSAKSTVSAAEASVAGSQSALAFEQKYGFGSGKDAAQQQLNSAERALDLARSDLARRQADVQSP